MRFHMESYIFPIDIIQIINEIQIEISWIFVELFKNETQCNLHRATSEFHISI